MTTYVPFAPQQNASPPFQATVTLDGSQYSLIVLWNMYRQDWYYILTAQDGTNIITAALIGSPPNADIYLAPGLFSASTILYRVSTQNFEVSP